MRYKKFAIGKRKKIAIVAHDNKKQDLLEWSRFNKDLHAQHELYATGTTGKLLEQELGIEIIKLQSGPLGGDQQIGSKIAEGDIDFMIFFWDPLEPQPHDTDVKALLRKLLQGSDSRKAQVVLRVDLPERRRRILSPLRLPFRHSGQEPPSVVSACWPVKAGVGSTGVCGLKPFTRCRFRGFALR